MRGLGRKAVNTNGATEKEWQGEKKASNNPQGNRSIRQTEAL
jgi:hypothetical protein